jgi:beta-galactosidase
MSKVDFNDNWICFKVGDEDRKVAVTLPHDAMLGEPRSVDADGGAHTGWFLGGDYVYEKDFIVTQEQLEGSIVFEFEGVYRHAEVFINGQKAAYRPYGYTNFYVNADKFIRQGKNSVKVIAYNSDQPNSRWYTGAGIYRPVYMYVLPKSRIEINGVKIKTLSLDPPVIEASVKTSGPGKLKIDILDESGRVAATRTAETDGLCVIRMDLPGCELWDCKNPRLHDCRVTFDGDVQIVRFGIRTVQVDSKRGFLLNGKRTLLLGACVHHDNGLLGAVAHPYAEYRKIRLLKESGYNAIRSAHNPCSKALLDACDKLGMLVMDEYVDMWYMHKTKYDYAAHVGEWWERDLSDMVDKDYNRPSVVMYSIGNEVAETAQKKGIELCGRMAEHLRRLDNRPVTCGINTFFNFLSSMGLGVYSDKKAEKAAPKKKKKAVGSEFFNNLAGIFGDGAMKLGATLKGSDTKTRDAFSKLDAAGYNYGILRYKKDAKKYPDRVMLGSETFCKDAYKFWELAKRIPALIGDFVWTGMDYLGEAGLGAWEYRHYAKDFARGFGWLTSGCGKLDITGKPSGEMAYTRVAFGLDKIRMAVVPVDHAFQRHSPSAWRMSNAIESWSWDGREGKTTKVEVYAKAHKAALFVNGTKVGERKFKKDCRLIFPVVYEHGELTAAAYDKDGNEIARTSLISAGVETKLSIIPEASSVEADRDLCYVWLAYTDDNGVVKPRIHGDIKVAVENGRLLALGHACPYNTDGYLNDSTGTYYGEALAIVKPSGKGEIKLTAESVFGNAAAIVRAL